MFEDEFEGLGSVASTMLVLRYPFRTEARLRSAIGAGGTADSKRTLSERLLSVLAWVAYLPVVLLYEAFAVPFVAGSVIVAAGLVAVAVVVAGPALLAARALRSLRSTSPAPTDTPGAPIDIAGEASLGAIGEA